MCGIHVAISHSRDETILPPFLKDCLCNRGPDHFGQATTRLPTSVPDTDSDAFLTFTSTVLSLRGDHVTKQPFQNNSSGSVLCWNGEAWRIDGRPVRGNDGEAIFALLTNASMSGARNTDAIVDVLRSIEGPFAFVYYDSPSETLYFGRDRLGRRSLLIRQDVGDLSLVISSVAETCDESWKEVEADGIYSIHFQRGSPSSIYPRPSRHEWLPESGTEYVSAHMVTLLRWSVCQTYYARFRASAGSTWLYPRTALDFCLLRSP